MRCHHRCKTCCILISVLVASSSVDPIPAILMTCCHALNKFQCGTFLRGTFCIQTCQLINFNKGETNIYGQISLHILYIFDLRINHISTSIS